MTVFSRREGSDDTRDVLGQAGVGLSFVTQDRPVIGGVLQTDKADDGAGSAWTRVTFTPDDPEPSGTVLACAFGDPAAASGGIDTAPFVVHAAGEVGAPFIKTRIAAAIWPRGSASSASGPLTTFPLPVVVGGGLAALSIVVDSDGPEAIVPVPDEPDLYVATTTADAYQVDMERQMARVVVQAFAPCYRILHDGQPQSAPFILPFHGHGRPGRETWGVGYVPCYFARPAVTPGQFYARFCGAPRIALVRDGRVVATRELPGSGNTTLGDLPTDARPGGGLVVVDLNDAYFAPVVVCTAPGCFVCIFSSFFRCKVSLCI